jgi:hypothetical protein
MFSNSRDFSLLARLPARRGSIPSIGIVIANISDFVKKIPPSPDRPVSRMI